MCFHKDHASIALKFGFTVRISLVLSTDVPLGVVGEDVPYDPRGRFPQRHAVGYV